MKKISINKYISNKKTVKMIKVAYLNKYIQPYNIKSSNYMGANKLLVCIVVVSM